MSAAASLKQRPLLADLSNGLRVAALPLPLQTGALAFFVRAGSRDEQEREAGFAHAVEHMLFKGAGPWDVEALARAMDALGGGVNAWTSRERICVHALFPADAWQEAWELVSQLALAPHFPAEEWARERGVIFAEMAMVEDDLPEWAADRHWESAFPDGFGRPVLGRRETLAAASVEDLRAFHQRSFGAPRLLIAACGGISAEAVMDAAAALEVPQAAAKAEPSRPAFAPGARCFARRSEQVHILISALHEPLRDRQRAPAALANQVLGAGMSSMLFQEVREKRGLAYSVGSHWDRYEQLSVWTVEASCAPEVAKECAEAVATTLQRFVGENVSETRLALARKQLTASLRMSLDRPLRVLERLGDAFLEEPHAMQEELDWVQETDASSVRALAETVWGEELAVSVAGPEAPARAALETLAARLGLSVFT